MKWIEWVPKNTPKHIIGRYTERVFDPIDGRFEPQSIEAFCSQCQTPFKRVCESGRPREWITRFVMVHRHGAA